MSVEAHVGAFVRCSRPLTATVPPHFGPLLKQVNIFDLETVLDLYSVQYYKVDF